MFPSSTLGHGSKPDFMIRYYNNSKQYFAEGSQVVGTTKTNAGNVVKYSSVKFVVVFNMAAGGVRR